MRHLKSFSRTRLPLNNSPINLGSSLPWQSWQKCCKNKVVANQPESYGLIHTTGIDPTSETPSTVKQLMYLTMRSDFWAATTSIKKELHQAGVDLECEACNFDYDSACTTH